MTVQDPWDAIALPTKGISPCERLIPIILIASIPFRLLGNYGSVLNGIIPANFIAFMGGLTQKLGLGPHGVYIGSFTTIESPWLVKS